MSYYYPEVPAAFPLICLLPPSSCLAIAGLEWQQSRRLGGGKKKSTCQYLLHHVVQMAIGSNVPSNTCSTIHQRYPFLAAGKSVVFQTKLGAYNYVSRGRHPRAGHQGTYNCLYNICKIICHRNDQGSFLRVIRAYLVYPCQDERASAGLRKTI